MVNRLLCALTFLQARPWVVAVARLAPEDGDGSPGLHEGQRVTVDVNQLLRLHIIGNVAICVHTSPLIAHP